jgi:DNA-binding NarL/FixJ family response regulator
VQRIRVLLANDHLIIPDSIRALRNLVEEQQDMEIVGDASGPTRILQEVGRTRAHVVIIAHEGSGEPGLCSHLLACYPDLTILNVSPDMAVAFTQQLCSRRRDLYGVQQEDMVRALREAVRNPCNESER